jgi:hypothetical protein
MQIDDRNAIMRDLRRERSLAWPALLTAADRRRTCPESSVLDEFDMAGKQTPLVRYPR